MSTAPTTLPANISQSLTLGGGSRELVGAKHLRVGHQDCKREHGDDRTDKDATELGKKLLTGVRTKQVTALQVGEQVGG